MKRTLLLALAVAPLFLAACAPEPPPPVVVHHHTTRVVRERERSTYSSPVDERRGNGRPEEFRAVERPQ